MFNLTEQNIETNVYEYLGIKLIYEGSKVTMRQNGFIKKFFKTTGWTQLNSNKTLFKHRPLGSDLENKDFKASWEYTSVVEMLIFLVNTRPDIQFAVHQCTRFTHAPKMSHLYTVKKT